MMVCVTTHPQRRKEVNLNVRVANERCQSTKPNDATETYVSEEMKVNVSLFALGTMSQVKSEQKCYVYEKVSCKKEGKEYILQSLSVASCTYQCERINDVTQ
jgi:hypothetical protein